MIIIRFQNNNPVKIHRFRCKTCFMWKDEYDVKRKSQIVYCSDKCRKEGQFIKSWLGLRFKIFNRDNFTCQYCGRKPDEVVLEIDHIEPISKFIHVKFGEDNLITSCRECNRGKGKNDVCLEKYLSKKHEQKKN